MANVHPSTRWLSRDFGELVREAGAADASPIDVLIVGSGYGGAVAAAEFAGCRGADGRPLSVVVLERGNEYLPGSFPSTMSDLGGHIRSAAPTTEGAEVGRIREGLFDLRMGPDVGIVVANGLGGGSLINAGVMEVPRPEVFDARWPRAVREDLLEGRYFRAARRRLGATLDGGDRDNTIEAHAGHQAQPLKKHVALRRMSVDSATGFGFRPAAITVAMSDTRSAAGVALSACQLCGDCATGCNHGAKESLDTNLLVEARRRGARLYTGGTVLHINPGDEHSPWQVHAAYTQQVLAERQGAPVVLRARRVILAAGAPATTEILLRSASKRPDLHLSARLGTRFSTNGDMIAAAYGQREEANAVADEAVPAGERRVGPTITGIIDAGIDLDDGRQVPVVIEEMAIPGPLRRAFEEVVTTADALHALGRSDAGRHRDGSPLPDPFAIDPAAIRRTQILAAMGDDGAAGRIELDRREADLPYDGLARVVWPEVGHRRLFDGQIEAMESLATRRDKRGKAAADGRIVANPAWRLLPDDMAFLVGGMRGPVLTVHPLGGCPMGEDAEQGVVDGLGRVFDPAGAPGAVHEGLVVLDASIMPCALGTNPALSITAIALRAAEGLRQAWGMHAPGAWQAPAEPIARPSLAAGGESAVSEKATTGAFTERLSGPLMLRGGGRDLDCVAELTLVFEPKPLLDLVRGQQAGEASLKARPASERAPGLSRLRIFERERWLAIQREEAHPGRREQRLVEAALYTAPVSGSLDVFEREPSSAMRRRLRGGWAWLRNRGLRDMWQSVFDRPPVKPSGPQPGFWGYVKGMWHLSSRAGEVRRFDYRLRIGPALAHDEGFAWLDASRLRGWELSGCKRITYAVLGNPLRQLTEMTVTHMPGLARRSPKRLCLDPGFLAKRGAPLFNIVEQRDQINALFDVGALGAYVLRMLIGIHVWTLRMPEVSRREPRRLPGPLANLPEPQIEEVVVDERDGREIRARLTRYPRADSPLPPVVMIHGYSASGTTFAHPSLKPSIAEYLWRQGRDVWVLDLRSSCGMETAREPWTFEGIALADIPAAVERVCQLSGSSQVDVIAHCMGAAMFSMAVLTADREVGDIMTPVDAAFIDRFRHARRALPGRVRRAVLSQVGPLMVLRPDNVLRAYFMQYLRYFVPGAVYDFRSEAELGSLAEQMLDRGFAAMPYPDEELRLQQPLLPWRRTSYVGTRHRMDALYGRTFKLANMSREALEHIDDFFGPLSIETVTQPIHFAREQLVTDRFGRNRFVSRRQLATHWRFPTLSLHGEENGLSDPATLARMRAEFMDAGCPLETWLIPGFGHQDCWIGRDSTPIYARVAAFLAPEAAVARADAERVAAGLGAETPAVVRPPLVRMPEAGPVLGPVRHDASEDIDLVPIGIGSSHALERPLYLALWPRGGDASQATLWPLPDADRDWIWVEVPATALPVGEDWFALLVYDESETLNSPAFRDGRPVPLKSRRFDFMTGALDARDCAFVKGIPAAAGRYVEITGDEALHAARLCRPAQPSGEISLALGSCQYPHGLIDAAPAYAAWRRLAERLDAPLSPELPRPTALMLAGDQIYADMTAGLFDPVQLDERFQRSYERLLHMEPVRRLTGRLPVLTMLDDHEIDDNWEPSHPQAAAHVRDRNESLRRLGLEHFRRYQRPPVEDGGGAGAPLWFRTEAYGLPLFIADTRSERGHRDAAGLAQARIMSGQQWRALDAWLGELGPERPGIVVCPSAVLPRHRYAAPPEPVPAGHAPATAALWSDAWDGYPASLHALLATLVERKLSHVVFLSGDEHLGMFSSARLRALDASDEAAVTVHFVHTGALYAPYPFANTSPEEMLGTERFEFEHDAGAGMRRYECDIRTQYAPGGGFTLVDVRPDARGWRLRCEFLHRSGASAANPVFETRLA